MLDHLCNSGSYIKLAKNPLKKISKTVALAIKSSSIVSSLSKNIIERNPITPRIYRAFRKSQPLSAAFDEAAASVAGWEGAAKFTPSKPQISIGDDAARWLEPLEARMPAAATQPFGRSPAGNDAK